MTPEVEQLLVLSELLEPYQFEFILAWTCLRLVLKAFLSTEDRFHIVKLWLELALL